MVACLEMVCVGARLAAFFGVAGAWRYQDGHVTNKLYVNCAGRGLSERYAHQTTRRGETPDFFASPSLHAGRLCRISGPRTLCRALRVRQRCQRTTDLCSTPGVRDAWLSAKPLLLRPAVYRSATVAELRLSVVGRLPQLRSLVPWRLPRGVSGRISRWTGAVAPVTKPF